ncbi:hypothetical protein [Noviluteimonas gilva]|uniref:Uncharacterized protein n=1 Tax=Noviluteimonas gilva TaxID=2682097 RepID=A0A7C9LLV7_9GAMM|nr:hypothetical protein [Lysobacter gilvus]MUV14564.1 hypothetical protein [Lysobacter gilvus]
MDRVLSGNAKTSLSLGQQARRVLLAAVVACLLLLPGVLTALVWTPVNFLVALGAIALTIASAVWLPQARWPFALLGAALVGIPPYPNWLWYDENGLVFRIGASLTDESPLRYLWLVLPALALFVVLHILVSTLRRVRE